MARGGLVMREDRRSRLYDLCWILEGEKTLPGKELVRVYDSPSKFHADWVALMEAKVISVDDSKFRGKDTSLRFKLEKPVTMSDLNRLFPYRVPVRQIEDVGEPFMEDDYEEALI